MQYLLLIYADEQVWTESERAKCYAESTDLAHELEAKGMYRGALPLQPVSTATSVQVREGRRIVKDGPFAEDAGTTRRIFLIDAKDLDEAIAIAGRIPGARKGTVEIRPAVKLGNLPEMTLAGVTREDNWKGERS